jgi:hypothetical protein
MWRREEVLVIEFSKSREPVGFAESLVEALKRENNMSQALSFLLSALRLDDARPWCPARNCLPDRPFRRKAAQRCSLTC